MGYITKYLTSLVNRERRGIDVRDYYRVQAEIDLDAIYQNAVKAKALTKSGTKLMAIIKADAYGHGATHAAKVLENVADAFGVAILEEGIELREAGVDKPILILGYTPQPLYEAMIKYDIGAAVFGFDMAKNMSDTAMRFGKKAKIHLKLDTGMNRIGFIPCDESLEEIKKIAALPGIAIEGCFSHFARMDEADKTSAKKQFNKYMDFTKKIEDVGIIIPIKHMSNSAGIIEMPEVNLDMVRDGISLYGLYPSDEVKKDRLPLIPAMQLRAFVSHVKTLPEGEEIGYGGTYTTTGETVVATIPVGYADGYPRALSGKGRVLIHGQSAPILGRVCMDQFMVDVTHINGVAQGDVVTLFGKDGDEFLPVEEVAALAYSFNYEFICDVGKRVPRAYYKDGKKIDTTDFYPNF